MTDKTSLSQYFSEVDGGRLLTKSEELELAEIMDRGRWHDKEGNLNPSKLWDFDKKPEDLGIDRKNFDSEEDFLIALEEERINTLRLARMAREKLINSNLRLVASVAKHYQNKGCALEDLIQEGNIGLMDGIDRFDYKKKLKISTYCTWWIRQRIDRLISNHGRTVRIPVHVQTLSNKLKSVTDEYQKEFDCMPTVPEIAASLDCTIDMAKQALQAIAPNPTIALDHSPSSMEENEESLHSYIEDKDAASPMDIVAQQELIETIKEVIKTLPERDEKILRLRFGIVEDPQDHESWPITKEELEELEKRSASIAA